MIADGLAEGMGIGRYRLEQRLGTGAFGEVWRASDGLQPAAIKFLNSNLLTHASSQQHMERLRGEIAALERLGGHPHIPALYGYDLNSPRPYLAMQYVDKPALNQLIGGGEILCVKLKQRLGVLLTVAQTIRDVHQAGILHRDIKPSHIHGINHPYLLDFSVALDLRSVLPIGHRVGTRLYMPPDDGMPPDERDDTYGLALVAYEVLFGRHPFYDAAAAVDSPPKLHNPPGLPAGLPNGDLPKALRGADLPKLEAVFSLALGRRSGRYTDPVAFVQDLQNATLIPENEQYLDYVPDAATSLSLQFSTEDDFTVDQVSRAAYVTEHGIGSGRPWKAIRWRRIMAVSLLLVAVVTLVFLFLNASSI